MHLQGALAARTITKSYGAKTVLEDVSLTVPARARIGVVGPNGSGKSTLLRLLAGLEEADAGRIERSPPELSVGYLAQEPDAAPDERVLDYLLRRTGEQRARRVAAKVGLAAELLDRRAGSLSGGQRARLALAAILLSRSDVLLLDEPTNDLDFAGLELLERFLAATRSALLVVSHDRELLDRVATRIVELEEGATGIREWAGGWSEYERARERTRLRQYAEHERHEAERDRLAEQARRMSEWERRGYGQGRKKKKGKDVKGTYRRRLGRLERDAPGKPFEPWELRLAFAEGGHAGDIVVRLQGVVVERDGFNLGPLDLELGRGERLVVAGPNGSGKTTLLEAILGRVPLAAGRRELGAGVEAAELEQGRTGFAGDDPLLATFTRLASLQPEAARTLLAKFGLAGGDVLRPASSLSPGERTRAALAAFAARGVGLLLLDEPTNHLDLPAIEQLEQALAVYQGTVVLVSHDRRFLERFEATRTLEIARNP